MNFITTNEALDAPIGLQEAHDARPERSCVMSQESKQRDRDRQQLERELRSADYQQLLERLQAEGRFPAHFPTWADVVAFMHGGSSRDPRKDEILRPLLTDYAITEDPRLWTILLVTFWPGLEAIHFQRRTWDADESERWQNLMWTFLQVVRRIDVERRGDRLAQKIFNDTVHRLYDEYQRIWKRQKTEVSVSARQLDAVTGGEEWAGFLEMEFVESRQSEIDRLREHVAAGRIAEVDLHLLVGTRLDGKGIRQCASELGISYEAAKKRRQRAEAAVGRIACFE